MRNQLHLTLFDTEAEYQQKKAELTPPNVSKARDTGKVFYTPEITPARSWLWGQEQIQWGNEIMVY